VEWTEEDDHRGACQDRLLNDYCTQIVSPPPPSPPNRIVFIALNLQLPVSPKAVKKTSLREAWSRNRISCGTRQWRSLRRRKLWDGGSYE